MSRVLPFSTVYPSYHPRAGEPTHFVEKIWAGLNIDAEYSVYIKFPNQLKNGKWQVPITWRDEKFNPKLHTIRSGHRWEAGDWFSPRVWLGGPYNSKRIIIAPDMQVKKTWDYEVKVHERSEVFFINGTAVSESNNYMQQWWNYGLIEEIAKNDGLEITDFLNWFKHPKPFDGQIISWSDNVNY